MKLIFSGTHGTGKTTAFNSLKKYPEFRNHVFITEVVRNLAKYGLKINRVADINSQKIIFDTYHKILTENNDYVSDRGLIDVLAYSMFLANKNRANNNNKEFNELIQNQISILKNFILKTDELVMVYFPIQFPLHADGIRDTDPDFQKKIDNNIRHILFEKINPELISNQKILTIPQKTHNIPLSASERAAWILKNCYF